MGQGNQRYNLAFTKTMKKALELASVASLISKSTYFVIGFKGELWGKGKDKLLDHYTIEEFYSLAIVESNAMQRPSKIIESPVVHPTCKSKAFGLFTCYPIKNQDGVILGFLAVFDDIAITIEPEQGFAIEILCTQISGVLEQEYCDDLQNYSELFELSEDLICICSTIGVMERVNPSFQRILGWSDEQILGKSLFDFVLESDRRNTKARLGRLVSRAGSVSFTHQIRTIKNGYRTVEWVATVVPTTGKVSAIGRDITEEIEKQKKLAISENKFKAFFESSQGLMCIHDLDGKFISVNESGAHILGYEKHELYGKGLFDIVPKKRHGLLDEYLKAIANAGYVKGQMITCAKDGTERIWMFSNVLQKDEQGGLYVIGNAVDITERHALEIDLLHTKSILEQTNAVARVGGWELDVLTQKIEWTRVTREIHGVDETFIPALDNAIEFFKPGASRERIIKAVQETMQTGNSYDLELEIVDAKGKLIWVRAIGNAVFKEGVCIRLFGTFRI